MKTELITKAELSEILKDIFKSIADELDEKSRQEHVGRDESAALSQVATAMNCEAEWHVNDVLNRRAEMAMEIKCAEGEVNMTGKTDEFSDAGKNGEVAGKFNRLDQVEHGGKHHDILTAINVYKTSEWWQADAIWRDTAPWKSWCYGYKTRKALLEHIRAIGHSDIVVLLDNTPA